MMLLPLRTIWRMLRHHSVTHGSWLNRRNNQFQLATHTRSLNVCLRQRLQLQKSFKLIWISMIKTTLFPTLELIMMLSLHKTTWRMLKSHWVTPGNLLNKRSNPSQLATHTLSQNVLLKLRQQLQRSSKPIWTSMIKTISCQTLVSITMSLLLKTIWRMPRLH